MRAICIGQSAYDVTLPLDHFPIENKKTRTSNMVECIGGSACNCAYLLAKWGIETYFAGVVGDDYYGDKIYEELNKVGVNTKYLIKDTNSRTASSHIIANTTSGTRTVIKYRDADIMTSSQTPSEKFDVILLDGYEVELATKVINDNPKAIKIIDAGALKDETVELAKLVDYVVCSKDFAEDFTNVKIDFNDISSLILVYTILKKNFKGKIVITLEDKGCFTYENGFKLIPTIKMKAIDTTGAGDIFHGAFTYAIANNYDIIETLKIANISGALSVTKIGGQYSIPSLSEVMDKYAEYSKTREST